MKPIHRTLLMALALSCPTVVSAQPTPQSIREATAAGPEANAQAGIQATVDAFRADLGDPNNGNAVGNQGAGRRQITWDGGDNDAAPARLPANFFNAIAPRGAIFDTDPRIQFQVSADAVNQTATPVEFGNINATYPTAFSTFSSPRLFAALTSNVIEVDFFVPGTLDPATVTGFGAVFTDVDTESTSKLEFFDVDGNLLFSRDVLATSGNESLSFLGVTFADPVIAHVRITAGVAALGPNDVTQGGTVDIAALDDFIYGEPVAVPDTDGDGTLDPDDGCPDDANKTDPGACGCGVADDDTDSDGVPDCFDICPGENDTADADNDNVPDCLDGCPDDPAKTSPGACGCGVSDADADSDSVPDCFDVCPGEDDRADTNNDGIPDCLYLPPADGGTGAPGCAAGALPPLAMLAPALLLFWSSRRRR